QQRAGVCTGDTTQASGVRGCMHWSTAQASVFGAYAMDHHPDSSVRAYALEHHQAAACRAPEKTLVEGQFLPDKEFIEARRLLLQNYLKQLAIHPVLRHSGELHAFLESESGFANSPLLKSHSPGNLLSSAARLPKQLIGSEPAVPAPAEVTQPTRASRDFMRVLKETKQAVKQSSALTKVSEAVGLGGVKKEGADTIQDDMELTEEVMPVLLELEKGLSEASRRAEQLVEKQQAHGDVAGELGMALIKLGNFEDAEGNRRGQYSESGAVLLDVAKEEQRIGRACVRLARLSRSAGAQTVAQLNVLHDQLHMCASVRRAMADRTDALLTVQTLGRAPLLRPPSPPTQLHEPLLHGPNPVLAAAQLRTPPCVCAGDGHWNDLDDGMWLSLWYPSDGYCLFEGVGDSSAAGSIYDQCLGAFSPAGGLVVDSHFMGYWRIAVNGDGHWNDLDDGMWLSLWYPSGGYCLFEGVGDSSAAGSIYVQCLGAFSPAGGLVIDTHFMGYWHLVVNGDGHWNDLDDGMWLSLWYPSDGYCLFECVGDSSTARFLGVSWIRLTLAPSPCTVLMVITHAGGLVFFDLDMKYWRIAVNGDGRRVEVGFGRRLSLWCHSGGHCLLESSVDSSVVLRGEAEDTEAKLKKERIEQLDQEGSKVFGGDKRNQRRIETLVKEAAACEASQRAATQEFNRIQGRNKEEWDRVTQERQRSMAAAISNFARVQMACAQRAHDVWAQMAEELGAASDANDEASSSSPTQ
ncbi:hypothetical protein CYMTET_28769, partial [Cymbomonas tetramitiformis]